VAPIRTPALLVYLMAGDDFPELAEAAVQAGATGIEMGIPYSDPLADGPSVQRAGQAALEAGITPPRALEILRATRERLGPDVPLIPMTYLAIVERYGIERFCSDAAAAGATGLIVPDLPPDEAQDVGAAAQAAGLDLVQLVSLTSRDDRIELACSVARGFVYVVAAIGTTGAREALDEERLGRLIARVRTYAGDLPLVCGFGISRGAQVAALRAAGADGVICGSAAVDAAHRGGAAELSTLVRDLAAGLPGAVAGGVA
jgi:tryptophan synthase alpha chain